MFIFTEDILASKRKIVLYGLKLKWALSVCMREKSIVFIIYMCAGDGWVGSSDN